MYESVLMILQNIFSHFFTLWGSDDEYEEQLLAYYVRLRDVFVVFLRCFAIQYVVRL